MRIFIFTLLVSCAALGNPLVNSKEEFDRHLHLHRKRVLTLGLAIRERFYPHLNYQELKSFLKYHDIGKTDLIHGKLQTSLSDLYRHYGTNLHDKEHEKLQKLVERINQIDKKIAMMFLESYKVSEQNRPLFKKIEWLADITDRGLDPVATEEFGRKLKKAVEFALDDESKEIVIWLQDHYDEITKPFQYCKNSLK